MAGVALRLLSLTALCVAALAVTVQVGARAAFAHGALAVSDPADGAALSEPVDLLSLTFTERPPPYAYFTVTAPSGIRVERPWAVADPVRLEEPVREYQLVGGVWEPRLFHVGFPVKVPVAYWPEQGLYVARYLSVASDGERVTGEVRFTYGGPTTPPPASWRAPTAAPGVELLAALGSPAAGDPMTAAPGNRGAGGALGWLLSTVIVAGAVLLVVRVGRRTGRADGGRRVERR